MKPAILAALLIAPIGYLAVGTSSGVPGCATYSEPAGAPVVLTLVDGVVADSAYHRSATNDGIDVAEIVCRDRAKELFGLDVRSGVISVWRAPGPLTLIELDFADLAHHQRHRFEQTGGYATEVGDLPEFRPHPRISFELAVTEAGWSATIHHDQLNHACHGGLGDEVPHCTGRHLHGS